MSSERTRWVPRRRIDGYEVLRTGRLGALGCGSDRADVERVLGPPQASGHRMKGYVLLKYGHVNLTLKSKGGIGQSFLVRAIWAAPGRAIACQWFQGGNGDGECRCVGELRGGT